MALDPVDEAHALQIQAGILGRKAGHGFEDTLTAKINSAAHPLTALATRLSNVATGDPADLPGVKHLAPRFGIVQMQRGGQKQHPDQLQFNLEAGYFYKL